MTRLPRLGLRARLVIAFVGVALLAADMATVYSNLNLNGRVSSAAHARLARSATHFGDVAGVVFEDSGGWTPGAIKTLRHLAEVDGLAVSVTGSAGQTILTIAPVSPVEHGAAITTPVMANGAEIAQITMSQLNGQLLTPEELQLRHELDRMHLVAGVTSAAIALAVALYLAWTLSRPLRQIRAGAEAMEKGNLDIRVREVGDEEVRSVARALNALASTLQHEEKVRKENVADLAHELRTPLMGLLARIEAAQDGVLDDDVANLAAMHDEALRLNRLYDDLSTLAEAERPGMLLALEPVDLAEVAAAQVQGASTRFEAKGIELQEELESAVVAGDRDRLSQVVANLLSNALRYTDAGGHVSVHVRQNGRGVLLDVTDTGIGIAPEDIPKVFTRFWRGERSRSRATGGAGIGLAIVRELVEAHGGRVDVSSSEGRGSTFTVYLPSAVSGDHGALRAHPR